MDSRGGFVSALAMSALSYASCVQPTAMASGMIFMSLHIILNWSGRGSARINRLLRIIWISVRCLWLALRGAMAENLRMAPDALTRQEIRQNRFQRDPHSPVDPLHGNSQVRGLLRDSVSRMTQSKFRQENAPVNKLTPGPFSDFADWIWHFLQGIRWQHSRIINDD